MTAAEELAQLRQRMRVLVMELRATADEIERRFLPPGSDTDRARYVTRWAVRDGRSGTE